MRAVAVVVAVALFASMALVADAVPAGSHRIQAQAVLAAEGDAVDAAAAAHEVVAQHEQCLKEIEKHTRDVEVVAFSSAVMHAPATKTAEKQMTVSSADAFRRAQWPYQSALSRSNAARNVEWMWRLYKPDTAGAVHTYQTAAGGKGDKQLEGDWAAGALWENSHDHPFGVAAGGGGSASTNAGRVCKFVLNDAVAGSNVSHTWLVEAPTLDTFRVLQSREYCYSLHEWLHDGGSSSSNSGAAAARGDDAGLQEANRFVAGLCSGRFVDVRKKIGGGQLLKKGSTEASAYLRGMQTLINAVRTGAPFATVAKVYTELFGVEITNFAAPATTTPGVPPAPYVWKSPSLRMTCTPRVPLICAHQQQQLFNEVSNYRKLVREATSALKPGPDTFAATEAAYLTHPVLAQWEAAQKFAETQAQNPRSGYSGALKQLKAEREKYSKLVEALALKRCHLQTQREYRVSLVSGTTRAPFLALTQQSARPVLVEAKPNDVGAQHVWVAVSCTANREPTNPLFVGVTDAAKSLPKCQSFRFTLVPATFNHAKALQGDNAEWAKLASPQEMVAMAETNGGSLAYAASRWELQICADKNEAAGGAAGAAQYRWLPSTSVTQV